MPQTVHSIDMPAARAGLVADSGTVQDTISRLAEPAAGLAAGLLVTPGTDPAKQAIPPAAAVDITDGDWLGVVMYDASKEPAKTAAAKAAGNEYDTQDMVPVLGKGRVWVRCDPAATITANTQAFVRFASGAGGTVPGRFRQNADTATAAALPRALFRSAHRDVNFQGEIQRVALVELLGASL